MFSRFCACGRYHYCPGIALPTMRNNKLLTDYDDFNQKEGLIPRSLLRNKLFQDMEEVIY